jgi:hypothetical protein
MVRKIILDASSGITSGAGAIGACVIQLSSDCHFTERQPATARHIRMTLAGIIAKLRLRVQSALPRNGLQKLLDAVAKCVWSFNWNDCRMVAAFPLISSRWLADING